MATWKRCSSCKKDIAFEATYYLCNVSTCRRKRTGMVFCSVDCWEAHLPMMRHREAWAEEEKAPSQAQWAQEQAEGDKPKRRVVASPPGGSAGAAKDGVRRRVIGAKPTAVPDGPREVLVVASRLKHFIREVWGMNTSDGVLDPLSDELRRLCVKAVENAKEDGRKTLLDRDFDFLTKR
jgi:hypothetical protein